MSNNEVKTSAFDIQNSLFDIHLAALLICFRQVLIPIRIRNIRF